MATPRSSLLLYFKVEVLWTTALTLAWSRSCFCKLVASCKISRFALIPPGDLDPPILPGMTKIKLDPNPSIWEVIKLFNPETREINKITEVTPITITSMVKIERSLLARIDRNAEDIVSVIIEYPHP